MDTHKDRNIHQKEFEKFRPKFEKGAQEKIYAFRAEAKELSSQLSSIEKQYTEKDVWLSNYGLRKLADEILGIINQLFLSHGLFNNVFIPAENADLAHMLNREAEDINRIFEKFHELITELEEIKKEIGPAENDYVLPEKLDKETMVRNQILKSKLFEAVSLAGDLNEILTELFNNPELVAHLYH